MINIDDSNKKDCCGCRACEQVCPVNCIAIERDSEGFLYPVVDKTKCVSCGKCDLVCPIKRKKDYYKETSEKEPKAYGGWIKDESIREQSSSGGAFSLFATWILEQDGLVYGAMQDEELYVQHMGVEYVEDLDKLRKSKYVQSDTKKSYFEIKNHLDDGRLVLFTGTPCQVAGLHSFLGENYDNLYMMDFICHGVPSPMIYESYIKFLEKKNKDEVRALQFRLKDRGWHPRIQLGTRIVMNSGKVIRKFPAFKDPYMNGFSDDLYLRPSCYECAFKSLPKYYADFTIADFWGVNKVDSELNDGKGTSLVLIHNKHGQELFDRVKDGFYYKECDFHKAIKRNKSLLESAGRNINRDKFYKEFSETSFSYVAKKYLNPFVWGIHKMSKIIWGMISHIIRVMLQPVLNIFHIVWDDDKWESFFQFIKFSMIGVTNVVVSYGVNICMLTLLYSFNYKFDYIIANITAFLISVLWSYHWNNKLVFRLKKGETRSRLKTLLKTYMAYAFTGLVVNNILSTVWIDIIGISKFVAPLMNIPFTVPINFLMNKLWAYKNKEQVIKDNDSQ